MNADLPDCGAPHLSFKDSRFSYVEPSDLKDNSSFDAYLSATDSPLKQVPVQVFIDKLDSVSRKSVPLANKTKPSKLLSEKEKSVLSNRKHKKI